jgi:hypothetical protein
VIIPVEPAPPIPVKPAPVIPAQAAPPLKAIFLAKKGEIKEFST